MPPRRANSIRRNIVANYLGQGWTAAMNLAFIPVYISYLGVESYGLIGFHATLHSWLSFAGNILGPVANRETARLSSCSCEITGTWNRIRSMEWIGTGCAVAISTLVAASSTFIAQFWLHSASLEPKTVATSISLMGPIIGLRILETFYQGVIAGLQRQTLLNYIVAITTSLRSIGAIGVLAWISPRIEYFFAWQIFSSLASLLILKMAAYRILPKAIIRPRLSIEALDPLRTFSAGMLLNTLFALMLNHADKLLLSKFLSLKDFGYYMLAYTLSSGLLFIMAPISQAYYPRFSQLVAKKDETQLIYQYHNGSRLVTLSVGPMCLLIAFFSQPTLFAWTGDSELSTQTAPLLTLLAIGNGLHTLMHMPYMLQLANGWSSLSARINGAACLIVIPAILLLVPRYGASGAAAIWIALNAGYLTLGISLMHKRILTKEHYTWCSQDIIFPLLPVIFFALLIRSTYPENLSRPMSALWLAFSALILYTISASLHFKCKHLHN